ncbi:Hypothetical protein GcLGCM259_2648 [Glutamicibacter creatinolyticus]|uniref:Uncharacterized protein n=1 Tax=Glutamicibacter creatinolyticus TaxID=162496 RepID=A0A5B7WY80_9MICC|nr:Hypothetical protein GcLGCM259_2648 [Glutamicibacter creatinolyticus]
MAYAARHGQGERRASGRDLLTSVLAVAYTVFLVFAAGWHFLLLSFIIYAPATILFVMARREQGRKAFEGREPVIFALSLLGALLGVVALGAGWIHF